MKSALYPKIFIVLLNWNGKKDTVECLHSLKKLNYPNFSTLVVDNGSTDGSIEALRDFEKDVILVENKKNLGFAGGNNVGIEYSMKQKADFVLLLNNDTTVHPDLLGAFVRASNAFPKGGIFGAKILNYFSPHEVDHFGGLWNAKKAEFVSFKKDCDSQTRSVDYVCGCAFFIKSDVIKQVGKLDPRFFLLWEESDYCFKAKHAGFDIFAVSDAIVYHKISASFTGGKPEMHYYWWRNRLLWIRKNLPLKERVFIYLKTLFPEIFKIYKLTLLKSSQLFLLRLFSSSAKINVRWEKLARYKAGCIGIQDYFFKNFGILKEKKKKKFFSKKEADIKKTK